MLRKLTQHEIFGVPLKYTVLALITHLYIALFYLMTDSVRIYDLRV